MLIRFTLQNLFSFRSSKEFNMLPSPRYRRLNEHKYQLNNLSLLKLAAIYGANGAGKSNLIEALSILQNLVTKEEIPPRFNEMQFKFQAKDSKVPQALSVEFFQDDIPFYYGIEILDGTVVSEELYISGLGKKEDQLLFERKTNKEETQLKFSADFESDKESQVLKKVIAKNFAKASKPIIKLLSILDNPYLEKIGLAVEWFENSLHIISPDSKPNSLSHKIDSDLDFNHFANKFMASFNIGIKELKVEKTKLDEFFGENNSEIKDKILLNLSEHPDSFVSLQSRGGDSIDIIKEEDGDVYVKQLLIEHQNNTSFSSHFDLNEESDGTVRLIDFIPAFQEVISDQKVYVIDEIERSIHPLLIKELINKFSKDNKTRGQLIFTTHESNLLDQSIFRQDEIWFAQKDKTGATDLYSLSDFKEHNTIDVRKGYLNGRYGAIPFLGNLKDLNWHKYDIEEKTF